MSPPDLVFFAGGECVERYGTIVKRTHPQHGGYTHTRSGAVGPFTARDGKLLQAEANVPRVSWLYDLDGAGLFNTAAYLTGEAAANLVTDDDLTNWSTSGTPVITPSVSDPYGGTGAYTVEDDAGTNEGIFLSVTFASNGTKCMSVVVRENTAPASGSQLVLIYDTTATTSRATLQITWSGGVPTGVAAVGTYLGAYYRGNGYWELFFLTTSVTFANSNEVQLVPCSAAVTGSYDIYRVNVYDKVAPPFALLNASESISADALSAPFGYDLADMAFYVKFFEIAGGVASANAMLSVGDFASITATAGRILLYHSSGFGSGRYGASLSVSGNTQITQFGSGDGGDTAFGQIVELCAQLTKVSGGYDLTLTERRDGGSVVTAGTLGGTVAIETLSAPTVYVGCASNADGLNPVLAAKIAFGSPSLDAMSAAY